MEPPVRGDGVHRHDDDERRNRTAPAQTSGQTAPRGELAADVSAAISAETGVTEGYESLDAVLANRSPITIRPTRKSPDPTKAASALRSQTVPLH